jgi:membrane associated rhomboid family serine protease
MSFAMPPITRGVKWLMIATGVLSVGVAGLAAWGPKGLGQSIAEYLILTPALLWHGWVWTLATYTFLNPSVFGLLIALLMLWMFAGPLEQRWGTRRFLTFYFATQVAAGLATALVGLASPAVATYGYLGIGTSLSALSAAFAIAFADNQILLGFLLPVRARYLIHITIGITLLYVLMEGSVIPFVAPVFGLLAGLIFARGALKGPRHLWLRFRVWWIERRLQGRKLRVVQGGERRSKSGSDGWLH